MTTPSSLAIAAATPAAVAAEAAALRALLDARRPELAATWRTVDLAGDGASPLVQAFWRAVGWSMGLRRARLAEPERATGEVRVRELLTEYREDDPAFSVTEATLPARYRLVDMDSGGVGFAITDESGGAADPPVLAVISDRGTVVPAHPSYLNWCANELARQAFSRWTRAAIVVAPASLVRAAPAPAPTLCPALRRLDDAVWLVPDRAMVASPDRDCSLAAESFEALVRWLSDTAAVAAIDVAHMPGDALTHEAPFAVPAGATARLRELPGAAEGGRYRVGWLDDVPVIVKETDEGTEVGVAPDDVDRLDALLGWDA